MNIKCCDGCGKHITYYYNMEYAKHIDDMISGNYMMGYVDNDGNMIGRKMSAENDLCSKCYNMIFIAAVKVLRELQTKNADRLQEIKYFFKNSETDA